MKKMAVVMGLKEWLGFGTADDRKGAAHGLVGHCSL